MYQLPDIMKSQYDNNINVAFNIDYGKIVAREKDIVNAKDNLLHR